MITNAKFKEIDDAIKELADKYPNISFAVLLTDDEITIVEGEKTVDYCLTGNMCRVCARDLIILHCELNHEVHEKDEERDENVH